jgi:hypothetical protein
MSLRLANPMSSVVWLAFLLPGRLAGGRLDFALALAVLAVACVTLWTKPSPWESRAPARRAAWLFGALQFLYVISYLYALAFKGAQTGPLDLFELPRWLFLGAFVVYLIRHYDASVRAATEAAMIASLYGSWIVFETAGERTYAAALTLAYLLLFSRARLRFLHASAAVVVLFFLGARPAWAAPQDLLRLIASSPVFGWGPARYEIVSGAGSQYLLWLARGGALGACVIAAGLAFAAYRLVLDEDDLRRRAKLASFLACVAALLLSGPYLDSARLFFATAFLLAAVHGSAA